jgi:hypothetical protein
LPAGRFSAGEVVGGRGEVVGRHQGSEAHPKMVVARCEVARGLLASRGGMPGHGSDGGGALAG